MSKIKKLVQGLSFSFATVRKVAPRTLYARAAACGSMIRIRYKSQKNEKFIQKNGQFAKKLSSIPLSTEKLTFYKGLKKLKKMLSKGNYLKISIDEIMLRSHYSRNREDLQPSR